MKTIDPELLRTLIAFADTGTLQRAADTVGRTPSAVTAQMQRLAEQVEMPILQTSGRGRVLTPAGEYLVMHARRILEAHRDAWLGLSGMITEGQVVIGITQDFTEGPLPGILGHIVRLHPGISIDLRVGRSSELTAQYQQNKIDVLVAMRGSDNAEELAVWNEQMIWFVSENGPILDQVEELPLALLDPPCRFREAAFDSLRAARRRYRVAAGSSSLAGIIAAVQAGIGISVRTAGWAKAGIVEAPVEYALPPLPEATFSVRVREEADQPAKQLARLMVDALGGIS
jgi:DNA-binding transcriptional LysR family regulator